MSTPKTRIDGPKRGDVFLRGDVVQGFHILEAITLQPIVGPVPTIEAAVEAARLHGAGTIWQQTLDLRGRPLGAPFRLLRPPQS
jgi:hypothetical protein